MEVVTPTTFRILLYYILLYLTNQHVKKYSSIKYRPKVINVKSCGQLVLPLIE